MGRYSFNHVTYDVIRYVHDNIVTAIQNAQSNLGQKQQQINEILQTSGLQGPDIDAYRTQLSDSWDAMTQSLNAVHDQIHEMLGGDGNVDMNSCDFGGYQPSGPGSQLPNGDISVAPGLQGHGYSAWREAIKNAAVSKIQGNWVGQIAELNSTLLALPMLAQEGMFLLNNAVNSVGQQVEATPWNALMDGMSGANPEDWNIPLVGGILGGLWDFGNFLDGTQGTLDQAQQRLKILDTISGNGFNDVTAQSLAPWPTPAANQTTTPSIDGGNGASIGGLGGGLGGGIPGGPILGGGPIPGGGVNDGGGLGGGTGGGLGGGLGGGGLGGGTGAGSTVPTPTLATTWADNAPDQFPQPQNLEDIAQELIRRQGGKHHLVLVTHFGPPDVNNWLVTIPDVGNNLANQDPNDPGYTDNFGSSGASLGGGGINLSGAPTVGATVGAGVSGANPSAAPASATGTDGATDPNSYLNNSQSISTEMDGHLSPYGQFVAEAIQKYATSQPADKGQTDPTASDPSQNDVASGAGGGFDGIGNQLANRLIPHKAVKLTCPPTSPNSPANLWLMGQGLGGLVAQNLSAAKPFPGDNPNLGPAHIVKSVVAFGAPIIGKKIAGVAYEFFKIKGDKLGDVPLDSVGVNDDRVKDVKELANPFSSPPWQTTDPKAKNYVKDPNDPSLIHNAYADSDQLKNTKLPFDITGNGGAWGPTYVVVIPPSSPTPGPMSASGAPVASGVGSGSSTSF